MRFNITLITALIAAALAAPVPDAPSTSVSNSTGSTGPSPTPAPTNGPLVVNGFAMPSASATNFQPAPDVSAAGSITILSTPLPSAGERSVPLGKSYAVAAALGLIVPASATLFF
jgi:hypothetical protein